MVVFEKSIKIKTSKPIELINITYEVEKTINESKIKEGICLVLVPHATVAMITNEFEQCLIEDVLKKISEDFPKKFRLEA